MKFTCHECTYCSTEKKEVKPILNPEKVDIAKGLGVCAVKNRLVILSDAGCEDGKKKK
jgi:hypothetical protein